MLNFIDLLYKDILAVAQKKNLISVLKVILISHSFHLVFFIRLGSLIAMIPFVGGFLRSLTEYFIRIIFSSDISCKAKIGPGLMILHGQDIVIGSSVTIGSNCKIFNGVTLGNKYTEIIDNAQPTVGNDVVISTGAKVLGGIRIGDRVIIGANCVLISDCTSGAVVVGVPGKVIRVNSV